MRPNPGRRPPEAQGKRVHVRLRNGYETKDKEPAGWPADGNGACNWSLSGSPFDIIEYEAIE